METTEIRTVEDVLERSALRATDIRARRDRPWSLLTGFRALDDVLHGLEPARLYAAVAWRWAGKSSFARALAERIAVDQQQPVLYFSLEQPAESVVTMMACGRARMSIARWRAGGAGEIDRLFMAQVSQRLESAPLFLDDSADLTIAQVRERARRSNQEHDIQLVLIDGANLLQAEPGRYNLDIVAAQVKAMAMELRIPVVVTAPMAAPLRDAADVIVQLGCDKPNVCTVSVTQAHGSASTLIELAYVPECMRIENLSAPE